MQLNLKKPLLFFDLETTGLDISSDRIVEMSYLKIGVNGDEKTVTMRFNPGMDENGKPVLISPEASAVHGITNEMVKDMPTFKEKAKEIAREFVGCDLAGYNSSRFDLPLLAEEFLRAGVDDIDLSRMKMIDVQNIFHKMEQRTLSAAYKFYCDADLNNAHSAEADTKATYEVLKAQLDRYSSLKNDMDFLSEFSCQTKNADFAGRVIYDDKGNEVINFGKYKGRTIEEVLKTDPGYYAWIMNPQTKFPAATKQVFTRVFLRTQSLFNLK